MYPKKSWKPTITRMMLISYVIFTLSNLIKIENSQDNEIQFIEEITDDISSHLGSWILDSCS